ncbi:MAG TPA: RNA polymerase sigma factor [Solirubrobacterales bacterium]|nr:RNA polymerase sigma factor [Solirubrobacterales bacterium]
MTEPAISRSIEAVWRIESTRLIAGLARFTGGDLDQAEDLAQDALLAAMEHWPETGVPANPGAWLISTAKNRAIDRHRRGRNLDDKYQQIGRETETRTDSVEAEVEARESDVVGDDVLSLIFTTCHPLLSREARVALTLRLLGGLTTEEIDRAFLAPKATIAQRITRAKRTLAEAKVPFEVPSEEDLERRLASVLEVIYLIFNEGYSAASGDDWMRPEMCEEAMRLGRTLATLLPDEPEVHGLVALMEIQASRMQTRVNSRGEPVLLLDQDRGRWDHLLINRGLAALERSESLGVPYGPYTLQAAIAACHARAVTASDTDWKRIVALYDALAEAQPSPVVELNRAVAVSMAYGPEEGLKLVDRLLGVTELSGYHFLPGVRGDLLQKLGRYDEAKLEFERAADLAGNRVEREVMLARAGECST